MVHTCPNPWYAKALKAAATRSGSVVGDHTILPDAAAPAADLGTVPQWAINPDRYSHVGRIWCLNLRQTRWWWENDGWQHCPDYEETAAAPPQPLPPILLHVAPAIDDAAADADAAAILNVQAAAARAYAA